MLCWTCRKPMVYVERTSHAGEDLSRWECYNPKCKTNKKR